MVGSNDGVTLPLPHLLETLNVFRAFARRPANGDLHPAVTTADVAFSLLLLATQAPQVAAMNLVEIHVQVKRLLAQGDRPIGLQPGTT